MYISTDYENTKNKAMSGETIFIEEYYISSEARDYWKWYGLPISLSKMGKDYFYYPELESGIFRNKKQFYINIENEKYSVEYKITDSNSNFYIYLKCRNVIFSPFWYYVDTLKELYEKKDHIKIKELIYKFRKIYDTAYYDTITGIEAVKKDYERIIHEMNELNKLHKTYI